MAREKHSVLRVVIVLTAILLLMAGGAVIHHQRPASGPVAPLTFSNPVSSNIASSPRPDSTNALAATKLPIDQALAVLASKPDRTRVQATLLGLRETLRALPADAASRQIRGFLSGTNDAITGQAFKVGPNGVLATAPTLRTFLLEELDHIDPAGAAACARQLLESMNSPDEWALALRSLARQQTDPEGRQLAAVKLQAMLTHEAWMRNPSVGFLEAFDVAVHLRDPAFIPTLTDLVRLQDNQAVAHAAYLALDRLTMSDPAATLAALQANPESMKGREVTRANYFARADVREEAQRILVENYLLQPALNPEELAKFAGLYPNANFMVSHNLLTKSDTPDHAWLAARDQAALQQVEAWLQDSRFERRQTQLREIQRRLRQFVQAGAAPGP
ncbi:MAG TPA: hypothetical protein VNU68_23050 [Verrucomicrobiae bacterium]|nr:hypothetical protein [Verrucomicrobiae bacterium]